MLPDSSSPAGLVASRIDNSIPAAITDIGCERDINEDRYAVIDSPTGRAWIVCDGMGGELGGELAAQLAIDAVRRSLESREFTNGIEAIRFAMEEANRVIVLRRQNPAFSAMGTTIVGTLIQGDEVVLCHAGDSRAYVVRDGAIQQLTVDHTYVQDLVDRGAISEEDAMSHPQSHVLTRCLGAEPRLELDTQTLWVWDVDEGEPEDRLVLCTDGLYSLVPDEEIAEIVSKFSPQESCVRLVETAKSRGGFDNITVAVLPLGGQLHEERSERSRLVAKAKSSKRRNVNAQTLAVSLKRSKRSVGRCLMLCIGWAVVGGALGLVAFLLKLMQL